MPVTSAAPLSIDLREKGVRQLPKVIERGTLYAALMAPAVTVASGLAMEAWAGQTLLFALCMVLTPVIVFFTLYGRSIDLKLLREGRLSYARLVEKTPYKSEGRTHYRLKFVYEAEGRECSREVRVEAAPELEDEAFEPIFFRPNDPFNSRLLDEMPLKPRLEGERLVFGREVEAAGYGPMFYGLVAIIVVHFGVLAWRAVTL